MILITGSTGFVGMNLLKELLKDNNNVVALYRSEVKKKKVEDFLNDIDCNNIIWRKSDINDIVSLEDAFEGIKKVYHCAGFISFSISDREKLNKVNIQGTENIVNLCIDKKIHKLIHLSSISALGEQTSGVNITEKTKYYESKYTSPYSNSKYNAELEIWRGIEEGVNSVIVSPGIILGKSIKGDSPQSKIEKMITQSPLCFYTKGKSGFVNISDVVNISIALMNSSISNEKFILVAKNLSFKSVICQLKKRLKIKKEIVSVRKIIFYLILFFDFILSFLWFKKRYLSLSLIKSLFNKNEYDGEKITKFLPNFNYKQI